MNRRKLSYCKHCRESFESSPTTPSYCALCPNCCRAANMESEYGFGICYPAGFYLGYRKVAELRRTGKYPDLQYVLWRLGEPAIPMDKLPYPDQMKKAYQLVYEWLTGEEPDSSV